jgi:hypothetical protein
LLNRDFFRDVRELIEKDVRRLLADLEGDSGTAKSEAGKPEMETGNSEIET